MNIRELLNNGNVIFDGAMGTYIASLDKTFERNCERANIQAPELVERIHREYIDAGANVILSNTFAANRAVYGEKEAEELLRAGWSIAAAAAGDRAVPAASIGQLNGERDFRSVEYKWIADVLLSTGAKVFLFETQNTAAGVTECAAYIKEKEPESFVIASFALNDAGYTTEGFFGETLRRTLEGDSNIDAVGFNCGCSASYMQRIVSRLSVNSKPLLVMPNAGYLTIVNRSAVYTGSEKHFADKCASMADYGAVMFGGCCGTTPAHIKALCEELDKRSGLAAQVSVAEPGREEPAAEPVCSVTCASAEGASRFFEKLENGLKPVAVELDPPKDADITKFVKGVEELKECGVDIITIADCPIGRARMDSSLLACKIHREYGIEALPHMTCRDRNLNATQALMLGLYSEGIRNMLLVTGDPVPSSDRDAVKSVYQFNSRKFAAFARSLRENMLDENVHFFGALNVNVRNFDTQLRMAKEKIENGMSGFLTQPVLTPEAFENLKRAREELDGYILGGIIPVVSEKNARFMDSEISGINVDSRVIELYAGKDREEAEDLAVEISSEIASQIGPYVDGFYLMTPFGRTSLMRRIIDEIR